METKKMETQVYVRSANKCSSCRRAAFGIFGSLCSFRDQIGNSFGENGSSIVREISSQHRGDGVSDVESCEETGGITRLGQRQGGFVLVIRCSIRASKALAKMIQRKNLPLSRREVFCLLTLASKHSSLTAVSNTRRPNQSKRAP
jgi:hypothetical protein